MKIQNRIALIFTILSGGIIFSLSVFIYFFARKNTETSFFHRLEVRADIVGHAALNDRKGHTSIYYDIKEKHLGDLPFEQHNVVWKDEPRKLAELKKSLQLPGAFFDQLEMTKAARVVKHHTSYVGLRIDQAGKGLIVVSSAVDQYGREELDNLRNLLFLGFFISMLFVFTAGKLFSNQIFEPIRRIISDVKGINAHNLHQRLVVDGRGDEVDELSNTFNDMLNRLEITFEMQNNFVSNASHEFRTPLTIISAEAELGLSLHGTTDAARDSFSAIFKETEKLEHLTGSMLSLAQTGFDGKKEQWEPIRIDELILAVKAAIDQMIPLNGVNINFDHLPDDEMMLVVKGNEALLKAAFTNIILNSCKYSDNKPVAVKVGIAGNYVSVEVTDQGIGIPDREISQIFVPFFRASNTNKYKGYGIGLPLTNNIIRLHQGHVLVQSTVGVGTRFMTYLPFQS